MKFTLSRRAALHTTEADAAVAFYRDVLGLQMSTAEGSHFIQTDALTMYIDGGAISPGVLFEVVVDDAEAARVLLESHGCKVLRWDGAGKACLMADPYGLSFNLWQDNGA